MTTTKATRATITLGDIKLDVFQLPDGSYRWSSKHISDAINIRHSRVAQICTSKQAQSLTGSRFGVADFSPTKLTTNDCGNISGYSTDVAFFIWQYESMKGNELAQSIVFASGVEVLERRADAAFNAIRTEEERNTRLAQRAKNIMIRRTLTDAIRDYTIKHESSETYIKFIYANCSEHLNKIILGAKAKQAKEFYALPAHSLLRNHIPVKALRELELVEEMASRLIDERDIEPLEAVKQACVICFTKTVGLE
jgi:hypothetical protein